MKTRERGSALAETALVVGVALLVLFNSLELGILGFYQVHTDAAAFMTARVQALADSATALSDVTSLPPDVSMQASLTVSGTQSQSVVTESWQGLLGFPNAAGSTSVTGEYIEPMATQSSVTSPFAFSVPSAVLPNYYPQGDVNDATVPYSPAYTSVYIAQNFGTSQGQGWNGQYGEWRDHAQCYAKINFPNSYASTQSGTVNGVYVVDPKTNPWSNFPNNSEEATIYGWDAGKAGTC